MIHNSLLELMTETVTWSTAVSADQYGVPSWSTGSGRIMQARITRTPGAVRNLDGSVIEQQGIVWCAFATGPSTFVPSADDRLVLPNGSSPPVLHVETFSDEAGFHHYKVKYGY